MELTASTLKRPPAKMLARFKVEDVGNDTVGDFLRLGWSLAICCRTCPRLIEWTPHDLKGRFGDRPDIRIAAIAERLSCKGEDGCGSVEIAVWPHPFEGTSATIR